MTANIGEIECEEWTSMSSDDRLQNTYLSLYSVVANRDPGTKFGEGINKNRHRSGEWQNIASTAAENSRHLFNPTIQVNSMHYLATPISVNISALISFFNDPTLEDHDDLDPIRTHAGSIKGLFAEELLLELLVHKLQEEGGSAEKLAEKCNVGKSGHRLDAWILAGDTLFQVEVKSWSAHGFGGKYNEGLSRSATWERLWNSESGQFRPPPLQKVLEKMKVPDRFKDHKVQPLACLWSAGAPDDSHSSLFSVARPNSNDDGFDTIWVFDAYEYLEAKRKNGEATIDLNLPQLGQRLAYLDAIFTRTPAAEPA